MMPKIDFRCPEELYAEIARLATLAGMSPGEWCRTVCAEKAGVKIEVKMGLGGADERTRRRVEKLRLKGIKERAKQGTES